MSSSHVSAYPRSMALASALCLSLTCSFPAFAQTFTDLRHIVFEPLPLNQTWDGPETVQNAISDDASLLHGGADPRSSTAAAIEEYLRQIGELTQGEGPYAEVLFQPMQSLAGLYLQHRDYEQALAFFQKAEHISRINHGLFSPLQIPLVEGQIDTLVALGGVREADSRRQYLTFLFEKSYGRDDLRTVPGLVGLAEWNMRLFHDTIGMESGNPVKLVEISPFATKEDMHREAFVRLYDAQSAFQRAIKVLLDNQAYDDPRLVELERHLVETLFLRANRDNLLFEREKFFAMRDARSTSNNMDMTLKDKELFKMGIEAHERMMTYAISGENARLRQFVDAKLGLGAWYLLFGKQAMAMKVYQEAHHILATLEIPGEAIEQEMRPAIPVSLPIFTTNALRNSNNLPGLADEQLTSGFVDVAFSINRNGRGRDVEVLASSDGTAPAVESKLIRAINESRFRPRFAAGEVIKEDRVSVRYFYAY